MTIVKKHCQMVFYNVWKMMRKVFWNVKKNVAKRFFATFEKRCERVFCNICHIFPLLDNIQICNMNPNVATYRLQYFLNVTKCCFCCSDARTKHIEVVFHFIHGKVANSNKGVTLRFISTSEQIANLFTKGLSGHHFQHLKSKLMVSSHKLAGKC